MTYTIIREGVCVKEYCAIDEAKKTVCAKVEMDGATFNFDGLSGWELHVGNNCHIIVDDDCIIDTGNSCHLILGSSNKVRCGEDCSIDVFHYSDIIVGGGSTIDSGHSNVVKSYGTQSVLIRRDDFSIIVLPENVTLKQDYDVGYAVRVSEYCEENLSKEDSVVTILKYGNEYTQPHNLGVDYVVAR